MGCMGWRRDSGEIIDSVVLLLMVALSGGLQGSNRGSKAVRIAWFFETFVGCEWCSGSIIPMRFLYLTTTGYVLI